MQQERPEDALPCLGHILENKKQDSVGMIYHLIGAYQAQGAHAEALALMDEREAAFPDLAGLKEYRNQRKISEKHKDSGKRVRWTSLETAGKTGYREGGKLSRLPRLIPVALVAMALVAYLGSVWWIGHNRKVFLLNGSDKPYTIALNDAEYTLKPGGPMAVRIPEGKTHIEFRNLPVPLEPVDCEIETNFWSRPFVRRTFVINPDRLAFVFRQEALYLEFPQGINPPPEVHFGQSLMAFEGIDYEFEPFPASLETKNSKIISKFGVGFEQFRSPGARLMAVINLMDRTGQIDYVQRYLMLEPKEGFFLWWLPTVLDAEAKLAFLRVRLDERPILVEWHEAYQSLMEKIHPEIDLRDKYRHIVTVLNNHPDALYLLAGVEPDQIAKRKLLLQAAEANPPCTQAFRELGFKALTMGEFKESIKWLEKLGPANSNYRVDHILLNEALLANNDYLRLVQELEIETSDPNAEYFSFVDLFRAVVLLGDAAKIKAVQTQLGKQILLNLHKAPGIAPFPYTQAQLDLEECCLHDDVTGYLKIATRNAETVSVCSYLLEGKLTEAETQLEKADKNNVGLNGLLYLYASRAKNPKIAETHWNTMVATLSKGGPEQRLAAEIAKGSKPLNAAQVLGLSILPQEKRVILAAFAVHFPDHAKEFLELARTLNYQHDAVSLCLAEAWKSRK